MDTILDSRRSFLSAISAILGGGAGLFALPAGDPAVGFAYSAPSAQPNQVVGEAFLQMVLFDRLFPDTIRPFFGAIDQYYTPLLVKAPGLIRYNRYKHFDLPFVLDLQLWENGKLCLKFIDGEEAKKAWALAMSKLPPGIAKRIIPEYAKLSHTIIHQHFILDKTLKD